MLFPPNRDAITDGKTPEKATDSWLDWFKQVTQFINFISPTFSGNQTTNLDMTVAPAKQNPFPGFLVLSWVTVASPLTLTLPIGPTNAVIVVSRPATGGSSLTVSAPGGPFTLSSQTWIVIMSDGTNWNKIMSGTL